MSELEDLVEFVRDKPKVLSAIGKLAATYGVDIGIALVGEGVSDVFQADDIVIGTSNLEPLALIHSDGTIIDMSEGEHET